MLKFAQMLTRKATFGSLTSQSLRASTISTESNRLTVSPDSKTDPHEPVDIPNPFEKERQLCILCKNSITPSYKNVKLLSQFQSPYTGRIYGRHITGLCKQKQEEVEKAIMRAQNCALMPSYHKDTEFLQEPKLFDPEKPLRPHKY